MAVLNPNFQSQVGKPLPVAFGYVAGAGNVEITTTDVAGNEYGINLLFDGENDGIEQLSCTATDPLTALGANVLGNTLAQGLTHFHAGRWTPIGLPNCTNSVGPDQGYDEYFNVIPTVTPPQAFSNICYFAHKLANNLHVGRIAGTLDSLQYYGVFRGSRCRYFDANGNVTGYGFTTNPTWHMVEVLLRFKFKRQQPQIAGLTDSEKACFNWPAIYAHAQRNDGAGFGRFAGTPPFMGNYVFAAQATLANMLETMLRCCRSYIDDQDGKIAFYGYDPVNSSFLLTNNHIVPGSVDLAQKDLTRAPNVFVPLYRDLGIPALITVNSLTVSNAGRSAGSASIPAGVWEAYFDTGGVNPFTSPANLTYGDGSNLALCTDWEVNVNPDPSVAIPGIWCVSPLSAAASSTGGYIGTQNTRFAKRAPTTVQHRRHQAATAVPAPGVSPLPNIVPVQYDLGNMTYDQANRLMQYECNSLLGNDAPGWTAPITGAIRVRLEAVDANGNLFSRLRPNQRITLDDTVCPEAPGDYLIDPQGGGIEIVPPMDGKDGYINVALKTYNPNAYPTTSYPPDDSLRTIASAQLTLLGTSQKMQYVAWVIQSTPSTSLVGGLVTVSVPDLTLQLLGAVGFTSLAGAAWIGLTPGTRYVLYVTVPTTGAPTFGFAAGSTMPTGLPTNTYFVMSGTFDGVTDFSPTTVNAVNVGGQ